MKVYNNQSVFDAALDRIRRIYDEFEHVYVSSSSGKDSTIVTELAVIVAREKGRLPVDVCFCDQEIEYQATVDYFRRLAQRKEINLHWFQVPYSLNNATSFDDNNLWVKCWDEGAKDKWMHPREPNAITDYGDLTKGKEIDFYQCCDLMGPYIYGKGVPFASMLGITAEESLNRYTLMHKKKPVYKDMFYASKRNVKGSFTFYPIYDWKVADVWHAIATNHWMYSTYYDKMFQMGVPKNQMRISSIIHETATVSLNQLKEIEPATFERLTQSIGGINTYRMLYQGDLYLPSKVPPMFSGWLEYRDYLMDHVVSEKQRPIFEKFIKGRNTEKEAEWDVVGILRNDVCGTTWANIKSSERVKQKYHKED